MPLVPRLVSLGPNCFGNFQTSRLIPAVACALTAASSATRRNSRLSRLAVMGQHPGSPHVVQQPDEAPHADQGERCHHTGPEGRAGPHDHGMSSGGLPWRG
jgi:hypothetical protein